jgi:hypothetical protein
VPIGIVTLLSGLGRGSHFRDAAISGAIVCLVWIYSIGIGLFVALTLPFVAITTAVFFIAAWHDRNELVRKFVWGAAIVAVLFASGLPQILIGLASDSAAHFYPKDLGRAERVLADGSIIFRGSERIGVVLAVTGIVGAARAALFDCGRMRSFGLAVTILAALICLASIVNVFIGVPGAIPIYYEYVLWLIYPIFAVYLLTPLLTAGSNAIYPRLFSCPERIERYLRRSAWLTMPLLGLLILHGLHFTHASTSGRPNIFPPRPSQITDFMHQQVGLSVGSPFNGRAATITDYGDIDTSWTGAFTDDMSLIRAIGNEHRSIGLWYYSIPTLFEFSHTIRPRLYMVTKYLLAGQADSQFRTVLNFRRPNLDVLRLLGVRYLVTDSPDPVNGMRRLRTIPISVSRSLAVDELPNPNLGVSPIQISVRTDQDAFGWLAQRKIDFETTALLSDEAVETGALTRATGITMVTERGGFRVHASSDAESLIVLPIQFSHCLVALPESGKPAPKIIRADFLLTGILFHKDLDALIEYRQGPFMNRLCGIEDVGEERGVLTLR